MKCSIFDKKAARAKSKILLGAKHLDLANAKSARDVLSAILSVSSLLIIISYVV